MNISIAVDFSTNEVALALGKADSEEVLLTASQLMSGREASSLLPWIIAQLQNNGYQLADITRWTCGTGPGSFTGLRIIASLVAGLTYGKIGVEVRGVPSGTAVTGTAEDEKAKSVVLYDGRNRELIGFISKNKPMLIISSDNLNQLDSFNDICALKSQLPAIEKILPPDKLKRVRLVDKFPIEKLLLNKTVPFQKNTQEEFFFEPDLVYIRPPV